MIRRDTEDVTKGLSTWQKLAYWILYVVLYLISLLPMAVLYGLSNVLYWICYKAIGYRIKVVRNNLHSSFPEKSDTELRTIERGFYHFLCDYIVETVKLLSMSEKEMRQCVTYHGMENITKHTSQGRSVIMYMGHYGGWEWVTGIGLHVPGDVVIGQIYHILENAPFNALFLKLRSHFGHENISMNVTLRTILNYKRKGTPIVVGFLSDQVPLYQATNHSLSFLNHPGTIVITGTERIIKQCDFACIYTDVHRTSRGHYDIDIVPMGEENKQVPDYELTDRYFKLLETSIRRQPELWLWSHNRWKRDKEGWEKWKAEQATKGNGKMSTNL